MPDLQEPIQDAPAFDYLPPSDLARLQANDQPGSQTIAVNYNVPQDRQEASAFIAPEVTPFNEVLSPGYDSEAADLHAAKARELAMRYKGQQQYAALIERGATPAEAYRATGHLLNYSNPEVQVKMDRLLNRANAQPFMPRAVNVGGQALVQVGPNSWERINPPSRTPPPEARAAQKSVQEKIDDARRELGRVTKEAGNPNSSIEDRGAAAKRAMAIQDELKALDAQRQTVSTNWMNTAMAPTAPTLQIPPMLVNQGPEGLVVSRNPEVIKNNPVDSSQVAPPEGSIVVDKAGKRYRVTNGLPVPIQ